MVLILGFGIYTALLVWLGRRPGQSGRAAFRDGNHQISPSAVFFMVTALWSSSLIVVEIDTAYTSGLSAIWYGMSVALMSVLVALLIPWFRQRQYVSNSALLGTVFGPTVKRISGLVIGATFPIFALSNALAAGAFLQVALGWPLWASMSLTTAALILYIQFAGLLSLARTQGLNFLVVMVGLLLAAGKLVSLTPTHGGTVPPTFWEWFGIGHGLVWVWFGMNTLNVFAAQAEIQAVASARDVRKAQRAVWWSTVLLLAIIGASTWMGMQTRIIFGHAKVDGLIAFAHVVNQGSPVWFTTVVGIGIWALALTWCGPLLFSGAMSLGGDVLARVEVVRWTRFALVVEGVAMILYGLWRPEEVAWWRVFGLTLRNAAVVGPTLALFLWKDLPSRAVISAMLAGIGVGLGLNALTGFSPVHFIGGINPMWSAASATFLVIALWRLCQVRQWAAAVVGLVGFGVLLAWLVRDVGRALGPGLLGVMVLLSGLLLMAYSWLVSRAKDKAVSGVGVDVLEQVMD